MYSISKSFDFCYGHRVWTQVLDTEYSLDACLKCRHLHGHQGKLIVELSDGNLNSQGMVVDFKMLNWLKKFIDDVLDHKFIMDLNDPLIPHECPAVIPESKDGSLNWDNINRVMTSYPQGYWTISNPVDWSYGNVAIQEKYEGMVFVDFVPTSENLSKWLFDIVSDKMSAINVTTKSVTLYETPKSKSTYEG